MNKTCANKDCRAELKYLRGGRLFLMERKASAVVCPPSMNSAHDPKNGSLQIATMASSAQSRPSVVMRRYFWLCEHCSNIYSIRRWTETGVELAPRMERGKIAMAPVPHEWSLPGIVG